VKKAKCELCAHYQQEALGRLKQVREYERKLSKVNDLLVELMLDATGGARVGQADIRKALLALGHKASALSAMFGGSHE
jgi:hypothetical protein